MLVDVAVDCVTDHGVVDVTVGCVMDVTTSHCVQGPNAIHEFPISFHYIHPNDMKLLYYLIYNVSTYGISYKFTAK